MISWMTLSLPSCQPSNTFLYAVISDSGRGCLSSVTGSGWNLALSRQSSMSRSWGEVEDDMG